MKRRLKHFKSAYREDKIEFSAITQSLTSYRGHLKQGHTYNLRKNIQSSFVLTKEKNNEKEDKKDEGKE